MRMCEKIKKNLLKGFKNKKDGLYYKEDLICDPFILKEKIECLSNNYNHPTIGYNEIKHRFVGSNYYFEYKGEYLERERKRKEWNEGEENFYKDNPRWNYFLSLGHGKDFNLESFWDFKNLVPKGHSVIAETFDSTSIHPGLLHGEKGLFRKDSKIKGTEKNKIWSIAKIFYNMQYVVKIYDWMPIDLFDPTSFENNENFESLLSKGFYVSHDINLRKRLMYFLNVHAFIR